MMKKFTAKDAPFPRPVNLGEARRQIETIFALNNWDERERRVFCEGIGIVYAEKLDPQPARAVLAEFERLRMAIYAD
jgi:hypothetical protein